MAGLADLYKQLPVNMRVFVETVLGNTGRITESDFSPNDLEFLRREYEKKLARNEQDEAEYRLRLENLPESLWGYHGGEPKDFAPERRKELEDRIASYERSRGVTSMSPADYASDQYTHEGGWASSIIQSFSDPSYRAGTTLGRFNVVQKEDGSVVIEDTYDWTKPPENMGLRDFLGAVSAVKSPEQLGNLFMRLFKPGTAREVNITLPNSYRSGGRVRLI